MIPHALHKEISITYKFWVFKTWVCLKYLSYWGHLQHIFPRQVCFPHQPLEVLLVRLLFVRFHFNLLQVALKVLLCQSRCLCLNRILFQLELFLGKRAMLLVIGSDFLFFSFLIWRSFWERILLKWLCKTACHILFKLAGRKNIFLWTKLRKIEELSHIHMLFHQNINVQRKLFFVYSQGSSSLFQLNCSTKWATGFWLNCSPGLWSFSAHTVVLKIVFD